ncbi:MAG: hypothetical protein HYX69_19395 [Planctomycetia bacterium]|nr:hypothetical protein [Planctomycetia bacterium]
MRDASLSAVSPDTRFATAYGVALLLAKMSIACAGYRLDPKSGGHRKTAFDALPLALGPGIKPLAQYFEIARRKRNEIDYDRAHVASEADANEIVLRTRALQAEVENWIAADHPPLAK